MPNSNDFIFHIPGPLPGLNEIIDACKTTHYSRGSIRMDKYASLKKTWGQRIAQTIELYRGSDEIKFSQVFIDFHWMEKNRRRDPDNIAAAKKFVLDGMVQAGLLKNDGWSQVKGWKDFFYVDAERPGVNVVVTDSEGLN